MASPTVDAAAAPLGDTCDAASPPLTEATAQPKRRGTKGMPSGVHEVKGKFQGRAGPKQRSVGLFSSVLEAANAVDRAKQLLAAGGDPWAGKEARTNKHKRGEKPQPEPKKGKKMKTVGDTDKKDGGTAPQEQRQQKLTTIPMPSCLDDVKDDGMREFLDQRSGEDL